MHFFSDKDVQNAYFKVINEHSPSNKTKMNGLEKVVTIQKTVPSILKKLQPNTISMKTQQKIALVTNNMNNGKLTIVPIQQAALNGAQKTPLQIKVSVVLFLEITIFFVDLLHSYK